MRSCLIGFDPDSFNSLIQVTAEYTVIKHASNVSVEENSSLSLFVCWLVCLVCWLVVAKD